jgi:hypothetical protein
MAFGQIRPRASDDRRDGAFAIAAVPAFVAVDHLRTAATLYAACAVLGVLSGVSATRNNCNYRGASSGRVRAGTLAIVYSLAISVFGGSTQFVITPG